MNVGRSNVHRWVNGTTDPVADAVFEIGDALEQIDPEAATEFIRLYLGEEK